jgi:hypothetical protein
MTRFAKPSAHEPIEPTASQKAAQKIVHMRQLNERAPFHRRR